MENKNIDRRKVLKITAYLIGGAVAAPIVTGVLSGCQTESGGSDVDAGGWKSSVLSDSQNRLVIEATERIMPETDTPGAKAAKVNQYVDIMLKDIYNQQEKEAFIAGLDRLEADAKTAHSKAFADCSPEQMDALLTECMKKDPDFFSNLKQLSIVGLFTSEIGATQVLKFDKIPGNYEGCIPFEDVGLTWAI